ncbi:alpha-tubulin suppressor-like RCC1 family protein [Kibdelosporangium banguiense]|uniref:Alpha-tubulin suppressor-like RCC1 family protein n=1 Tax=Kibdelosporangium banguiense TaxID=1365924 RepID=A0ABS4TYQ9_9PSEU|nr:RCC1 domain-containing protein [Kibdelosporangium banguiense]MBP2329548.1 alpha-tubulin suppressor-like RCC1 family protein [Kibdelosporangium banguiense]
MVAFASVAVLLAIAPAAADPATSRTVLAWGENWGQLGDGTDTNRSVPVPVCAVGETAPCHRFLSGVTKIAAAGGHSLALTSGGRVLAWGANQEGQLGDGTLIDRSVPVPVCAVGETAPCHRFLTGVTGIDGGYLHSVATVSGGRALAWGDNQHGQLGDGTNTNRSVPVPVCAVGETAPCHRFLTGVTKIAAALRHSLAIVG